MKNTLPTVVLVLAAIIASSMVTYVVVAPEALVETGEVKGGNSAEPIYWVAPMDPNYRRDRPGKSPMGMDLVPVYDDAMAGSDAAVGTVKISPEVVNNLGVRTRQASLEVWKSDISTVGYVQYDENRLIHIHPRVEGWVERLYISAEGDPVEQGQPLYDLYSPALVNAQNELLLALKRKNHTLIIAAKDRLKALQFPPSAIDALEKTRQARQAVTFYSPQQGVVDNLNIREGFFVQPGTRIMSIGSLSEVWVEAEVFERQVPLLQEGAPVSMTLDYLPGKTWRGKVDYIYPTLDEETRTLKVRLRFSNENRELRPNMFAQVSISSEGSRKTLIVPREAVIRTGKMDRLVLALGDGRFRSVEVTLGRVSDANAEILAGIAVGDRVVTSAQFLLDSESSKSADFARMDRRSNHQPETEGDMMESHNHD